MAQDAFPAIGEMSVGEVEQGHVRDLLAPIWLEKPETARRVFQRVRAVLDWAHAKQYRTVELPSRAVMRGLPRQSRKVEHFKALPYVEVPAFIRSLRERESVSRLALEVLILTAVRSGSVRLASWSELDLEQALWRVPAAHMKGGEDHVVPLSTYAVAAFRKAEALRHAPPPYT